VLPLRPGIVKSAATITSGMGHYVGRCVKAAMPAAGQVTDPCYPITGTRNSVL
jgi:hypothetical protein